MPGGKKAPRTKGNAKPSSSSRASNILQQEGQSGFIGFSGLTHNNFGYVPQTKVDDSELDDDLRLLLRKMTKKDNVTKLKAIQEFTTVCKVKDNGSIRSVLSFWPRIYNKLANDFDHRVREATQQAHHQITTKSGRNLAPYLKLVITSWLMAQFDTYVPAASAAQISFNEVFPVNKKKEVLTHCKAEILECAQNNILKETADTLSDPKIVPVEERQAKYIRYISSSFYVLKYFFENLPVDVIEMLHEEIRVIFAEKKFWKFARNDSPMIRSSFYSFLSVSCEYLNQPITDFLPQFSVAVLTNLDDQEPIVVKSLWDAALLCLSTFENCWNHVNARKAVLPKLWKLLKNCGYGNISVVYPNLLPFLSKVSIQVIGAGTGFYEEFFNNILVGLYEKQDVLTSSDTKLVMSAYMECIRYIVCNQTSKEIVEYVSQKQIHSVLSKLFYSPNKRQMWYGIFFIELRSLLLYVNNQSKRTEEFNFLQKEFWCTLTDVIIGNKRFRKENQNFFESLVDLIFCLCIKGASLEENTDSPLSIEVSTATVTVREDLTEKHNGFLLIFLQDITECYLVEIFVKHSSKLKEHFIKVMLLILNKEVLQFIINRKLDMNNENNQLNNASREIEICSKFVQIVVLPLLNNDKNLMKNTDSVKLLVALVGLLPDDEKVQYLTSIFQEKTLVGDVSMYLLAEVFKYFSNIKVMNWLRSEFVQNQILTLCTDEKIATNKELFKLKWTILEAYLSVVQDDREKLSKYVERFLLVLKKYFSCCDNQNEECDEIVLKSYSSLCTVSFELPDMFFETLLAVFQASVNLKEDSSRFNQAIEIAFKTVFKNKEADHYQRLFQTFSTWIKEGKYPENGRLHSGLCNLVQIAKDVSSMELMFDKLFVEELLRSSNPQKNSSFSSELLSTLLVTNISTLKLCDEKLLIDQILNGFIHAIQSNVSLIHLQNCISLCEHLHESLLKETVKRSEVKHDLLCTVLDILKKNNQLTESLLDHCLMLTSPVDNYDNCSLVEIYCVVLAFVEDISCIRALVEKCVDDMENNAIIKNNKKAFCSFLKITCTTISKWFSLFSKFYDQLDSMGDYTTVVTTILDNILVWRGENAEQLLFSCPLTDNVSIDVLLNTNLIELLCYFSKTCFQCYREEHWDFILCSLVSWLQTCEESLESRTNRFDVGPFLTKTFNFFATIAAIFNWHSNSSSKFVLENVVPCVVTDIFPIHSTQLRTELLTEWQEFFSPAASKALLQIYIKVIVSSNAENVDFASALCGCIQFIPAMVLIEFVYGNNEATKKKKLLLEKFCNSCFDVINTSSWYFKISSYQLLVKLGDLIEKSLCANKKEDEQNEGLRTFPSALIRIMETSRNKTLLILSDEAASIRIPLQSLDSSDKNSTLLTYLLSWQLILRIFKLSAPDDRAKFAHYFHKNSHVNDLLTCLFCIMPTIIDAGSKLNLLKLGYTSIQQVAFHLLTSAMECIPALIRFWFNNIVDRKDAGTIDKFMSAYGSPVLLKNEFQKLEVSSKEFDNMVVKTRSVAREVVAVYTVEEISMELVVKLSANHPLTPVSVECGKRIGVSNARWRQWMLQLTTFLSFQNGTILDGLALWKENVDKRFEGVEECLVCFSVIHGSNYSLPSIACKTCKKKFHPVCLYKWFSTSGKSMCPLCRNIF